MAEYGRKEGERKLQLVLKDLSMGQIKQLVIELENLKAMRTRAHGKDRALLEYFIYSLRSGEISVKTIGNVSAFMDDFLQTER